MIYDVYKCPDCGYTTYWNNQNYREQGNPVCPNDDHDMEFVKEIEE